MKKISISLVILFLTTAFVFGLSIYKRYWQLSVWNQQKELTYAKDGRISMTTLDAYYWTRLAKEYKNGKFGDNVTDPLKTYPDSGTYPERPNMIVFLLAKLSTFFKGDIYMTGIYITPILSSLFIIPMVIYFYRIGFGLIGLAGGLFGTFSYAFYVRSCNGRVDTDSLNLFFPIFVAFFFLMISKTDEKKKQYIYSVIAGFGMLLFNWWYEKYGFGVVYAGTLVIFLLVNRFKIKDIAILTGIYILFSNPVYFFYGLGNLFDFVFKTGYFHKQGITLANIAWPNIMETITESNRKSSIEILQMILGNPKVAVIGILGILAVYVLKFKDMIPMWPLLLLGSLAFFSGNRFSMFLAPLAGAGLGFVIFYPLYHLFKYLKINEKLVDVVTALLIFILFFVSAKNITAYNIVLPPSIPTQIVNGFLDIKEKLPKGSPVFTWWDFGYALMDIGEFATYHDGGAHGADRSYFSAKAFVIDDQKKMYNLISAIDNYKFEGINKILDDNKSANKVVESFLNYNSKPKNNNIFILYTADMIGKFGALSFFGEWDFETKSSKPNHYQGINCLEIRGNVLECENALIDMEKGLINGQIPVKRVVFVKNGSIDHKLEFPHESDINIELLIVNKQVIGVYVLNEKVYKSNFNQMYILGEYDRNLFEEIYNDFPHTRAFKLKK